MVIYSEILEQALEDPRLEVDKCLTSKTYKALIGTLDCLLPGTYISEWKEGLTFINYFYLIHTQEIGERLKEARDRGIKGGHPSLVWIQRKEDLEKFLILGEASANDLSS